MREDKFAWKAGDVEITFMYGMRLRGFSPGTFPKEGFLRREDDETGKYWDVLVYSRRLTDKEVEEYELDLI